MIIGLMLGPQKISIYEMKKKVVKQFFLSGSRTNRIITIICGKCTGKFYQIERRLTKII